MLVPCNYFTRICAYIVFLITSNFVFTWLAIRYVNYGWRWKSIARSGFRAGIVPCPVDKPSKRLPGRVLALCKKHNSMRLTSVRESCRHDPFVWPACESSHPPSPGSPRRGQLRGAAVSISQVYTPYTAIECLCLASWGRGGRCGQP